MKRINIIGTSGSGKSTIGKKLAKKLGYPYYQMDALSDCGVLKQLRHLFQILVKTLDGDNINANTQPFSKK